MTAATQISQLHYTAYQHCILQMWKNKCTQMYRLAKNMTDMTSIQLITACGDVINLSINHNPHLYNATCHSK